MRLRETLRGKRILVSGGTTGIGRESVVQPGSVATDMQECSDVEKREAVAREEMLHAEEIAEAIEFIPTRSRRADVVNLRIEPRLQKTAYCEFLPAAAVLYFRWLLRRTFCRWWRIVGALSGLAGGPPLIVGLVGLLFSVGHMLLSSLARGGVAWFDMAVVGRRTWGGAERHLIDGFPHIGQFGLGFAAVGTGLVLAHVAAAKREDGEQQARVNAQRAPRNSHSFGISHRSLPISDG